MKKNSTTDLSNLAIIGGGPTALFLLKYISDNIEVFKNVIQRITFFEKQKVLGMGMPYDPATTDIYNLANISSEEIPLLHESFGDWLRNQDRELLSKLNIRDEKIDDSKVYSRVALGHYFEDQFLKLTAIVEENGIEIIKNVNCEVLDINKEGEENITIIDYENKKQSFSTIIVANGHEWKEKDRPESGYYASPWPIHKLIPKKENNYNFPVGILGASLSAFDVVTTLAHRHGKFKKEDNKLIYQKNSENPDFKLVLHSAEGWLPHLQYEQEEPIREIYRHFDRKQLLELINQEGFLRIEDYFDVLCRPVLIEAFTKDNLTDVVEKLNDKNFSFKNLVELMSDKHQYIDSFEGMKKEMRIAKDSIENKNPIHWMEKLDDLMYSLNYHAELLPAEDHLYFHKEIMSFLMNVIAALPLSSAEILLVLYDAHCIDLKTGRVKIDNDSFKDNYTKINVEKSDGSEEKEEFKIFISCGGGKKISGEEYPFQSLVKNGIVGNASAVFADQNISKSTKDKFDNKYLIVQNNVKKMILSGINIDSGYRTINSNNTTNSFLFDINFNHTNGLRPYSYGLQACSATSLILIDSLLAEILYQKNIGRDIESITTLYENEDEL